MNISIPFSIQTISISFTVLLAVTACNKPDPISTVEPKASTAAAQAKSSKVYVVATDAAYEPFEYIRSDGVIEGFDVDVVKAIAAKSGIQVKFVNTPWDNIFKTLDTGESDMVVSSVTITDERKKVMDFSKTYFYAYQLIAVKESTNLTRMEDLKSMKVGVQSGTTGEEAVLKLQGKTSTNISKYDSGALALEALEAGKVNAVVADNGLIQHHIKKHPAAKLKKIYDPSFMPEAYGIAIKKGNLELNKLIDNGLAGIKADGTYQDIYSKYFGEGISLTK